MAFVVQDLDLASGLAEPGRWCEIILQFRLSHAPIADPELCFPKLTSTVNASLCKRWSVCPPHDPAAGAVKAENIESAAGGIYLAAFWRYGEVRSANGWVLPTLRARLVHDGAFKFSVLLATSRDGP